MLIKLAAQAQILENRQTGDKIQVSHKDLS